MSYQGRRDFELALADFNKAIELDPTYALAFASRGTVEAILGQPDAASKDLDRAIELDATEKVVLPSTGGDFG